MRLRTPATESSIDPAAPTPGTAPACGGGNDGLWQLLVGTAVASLPFLTVVGLILGWQAAAVVVASGVAAGTATAGTAALLTLRSERNTDRSAQ